MADVRESQGSQIVQKASTTLSGTVCVCGSTFSANCNFCNKCGSKKAELARMTDSQIEKVKERIAKGAASGVGRSASMAHSHTASLSRAATSGGAIHFKPSGTKHFGSLMEHPERGDHDRCDGILGLITDLTGFPFLNDPMHDVRRAFALKVFSLLSVQMCVVMAMVVAIDYALPCEEDPRDNEKWGYAVMAFSFIGLVISSSCLRVFGSKYPTNYILLAITTVFAGIFWGITNVNTGCDKIAMQLIFILTVMVVATLPFFKFMHLQDPGVEFMGTLFFAWFVGMMVNACVFRYVVPVYQGAVFVASFFTIMTVMGFLFDAGKLIVHCETDQFMKAVSAMNTDLLLVITFFFIFCLMAVGINPEMDSGGVGGGWEDGELGVGGESGGDGATNFDGGGNGPLVIGDGGLANIAYGDDQEESRRKAENIIRTDV